jgi:hypothetical protein
MPAATIPRLRRWKKTFRNFRLQRMFEERLIAQGFQPVKPLPEVLVDRGLYKAHYWHSCTTGKFTHGEIEYAAEGEML